MWSLFQTQLSIQVVIMYFKCISNHRNTFSVDTLYQQPLEIVGRATGFKINIFSPSYNCLKSVLAGAVHASS